MTEYCDCFTISTDYFNNSVMMRDEGRGRETTRGRDKENLKYVSIKSFLQSAKPWITSLVIAIDILERSITLKVDLYFYTERPSKAWN